MGGEGPNRAPSCPTRTSRPTRTSSPTRTSRPTRRVHHSRWAAPSDERQLRPLHRESSTLEGQAIAPGPVHGVVGAAQVSCTGVEHVCGHTDLVPSPCRASAAPRPLRRVAAAHLHGCATQSHVYNSVTASRRALPDRAVGQLSYRPCRSQDGRGNLLAHN